jgi:hypothetical protein
MNLKTEAKYVPLGAYGVLILVHGAGFENTDGSIIRLGH